MRARERERERERERLTVYILVLTDLLGNLVQPGQLLVVQYRM